MRILFAPLLLLAGPSAVHAQYIFGHGAQFSDGPARSEVEAEFTYIDVDPPCEISMLIGVDRKGKVVSAEAEGGPAWCTDTIVLGKALRSVRARVFNAAPDAPKVQRGRVHWSYHQPETDIMDPIAMPDVVEKNEILDAAAVEEQPVFPGGQEAMFTYIAKQLKYPDDAMDERVQGKVFIEFVVGADGMVTDVTVRRGVNSSLDREAVRVVKSMPKWKPGMQNGRPVAVRYTLPIFISPR